MILDAKSNDDSRSRSRSRGLYLNGKYCCINIIYSIIVVKLTDYACGCNVYMETIFS